MYKTLTTAITGIILLLLTTTTTSFVIPPQSPPSSPSTPNLNKRAPLNQLLTIVPSATTCSSSPYPSECATASTALAPILASLAKYDITTAAEQAALLSWMAYESGEFKYNQNHFPAPGTPGQGTRTMMSPAYVKEYALSIPEIAGEVSGKSAADVLGLVQGDAYSFGSAAWFYSSKCSEAVKASVRSGSRVGWEGFVTGCVGTVVDEGSGDQSRVAYWERAMGALGVNVS